MTNPELKACPFCGQLPIFYETNGDGWILYCTCGFSFEPIDPTINRFDKSALIALWNTRPLESALTEQIKQQEELIEKLDKSLEKEMIYTQSNIDELNAEIKCQATQIKALRGDGETLNNYLIALGYGRTQFETANKLLQHHEALITKLDEENKK